MVSDGSGEVRPGIEKGCNSCVVLCEELYECRRTKDSWVGLMTKSFNGGGTCIIGDGKSLHFELLSLLLKHWLSLGVLCEDLDDCWQTEDIWDGLISELFNEGETDITVNKKALLFEWQSLRLKHWLSRGVVHCLPWLFPVPLLWLLPIPFKRGMMNTIWVCGVVVCLLFCFFDCHQKVRANFLARQLQSCLSLHTRNKNWLWFFVLISS